MSFFNVFSHEPPILIFGMQGRDRMEKDTVANISRTGDFVVNMVDLALAEAMILSGIDFPRDVDELAFAGLTGTAGDAGRAAAHRRVALCHGVQGVERLIDLRAARSSSARWSQMHVRDDCLDAAGRYVTPAAYQPIARMHADNYIASDRQFVLAKPAGLPRPRPRGGISPAGPASTVAKRSQN